MTEWHSAPLPQPPSPPETPMGSLASGVAEGEAGGMVTNLRNFLIFYQIMQILAPPDKNSLKLGVGHPQAKSWLTPISLGEVVWALQWLCGFSKKLQPWRSGSVMNHSVTLELDSCYNKGEMIVPFTGVIRFFGFFGANPESANF